jgi:flagellar biosynthetic protein FlhB
MSAGDKTEKPTPKRRQEARREGRIARSADINSAAVIAGGALAAAALAPAFLEGSLRLVVEGLEYGARPELVSSDGLGELAMWSLKAFAYTAGPLILAFGAIGLVASIAQVGIRLSPVALKPSFKKLNPLPGMKRMFGKDGAVEAVKATAKTGAICLVAFMVLWPQVQELSSLVGLPPAALLAELADMVRDLFLRVGIALVLLAALDYAWQFYKTERDMKMTKAELKQELKQQDVPAEVKQQQRMRQREMSRGRMLAEVLSADVVVVNPTHYACALRYDGTKPAPELVAKGVDHVAAAIREKAKEANVPIVSNPPLARAIHAQVEIGQQIPAEFFTAVAEVLAFVFRTAKRRRPRPVTTPRRNGRILKAAARAADNG